MLGQLEHDEGETRKLYLGEDCLTVSRTAYKCILGGSVPFPFGKCPRSRSRLCCNERLVECVNPPPNGRGGRTPLDTRDGLPIVHYTNVRRHTFRPFAKRLSTRIQPLVTQQCSGAIGEIGNMYVCFYKEQTK